MKETIKATFVKDGKWWVAYTDDIPGAMTQGKTIKEAEEGGYWAEVPALPWCISEGDNLEELKSNLKEAITGWLEVYNEELEKKVSSSFKVLELAV